MTHENGQEISIRLAQPIDNDVIVELQLISIETLCAQDYSSEQLQALLQNKSHHRYWDENIFIAEIGELIVGFAALQKHSYVITAMFVHPQYTRQRIGTKLLLHIEKIVIQKRIKQLFVYSSLNGQEFYTYNGFTIIGQHNILLQNRINLPSLKMRKRLLVEPEKQYSKQLINNPAQKQDSIIKLIFKIFICSIILLLFIV